MCLMQEGRVGGADSAMLLRHKSLLDDRLDAFSAHSAALRTLLTFQRDQQGVTSRLTEQRDRLLDRLARTQDLHQVWDPGPSPGMGPRTWYET